MSYIRRETAENAHAKAKMNETFLGKISDFSIPINAPSLCGQKSGGSHHRLPNVCGIQSQVMAAAQMAFWARMHGLTRADIRSALWKSRTLVKTSCMRQTLHLLPAADFSIYINALRRSRVEALRRIMSKFGITQKEFDGMNEAVMEALGAGPMTQGELADQIASKVGKNVRTWMEHVWSVFRPAIVEGLICYGPDRGQEVTFVRVDQWLPRQREVSAQEAQQVLLRRYLSAYGPATLQDFSRWTGIPMKEARAVGESLEENWGKSVSRIGKDGFSAKIIKNWQIAILAIKFCAYYRVSIPICSAM